MEVLGIDIGASGIKGGIVDTETGQLLAERYRINTPASGKPDAIARVIQKQVNHFKWFNPLGVGFPSVVINGVVKTAANIDISWIGLNAEKLIHDVIGLPVYVLNDADAAGLAEMIFGAGRDHKKGVVLMITLGTGIGTAVFSDGVLVRNTEFGHLNIRGKDAEHRASDAVRKNKDLTWKKWSNRLKEYLIEMEKLFWPDLFIIGGGVSKEAQAFFPYLSIRTKVVQAELLNQAGIIGAAVFAAQNHSL